MAEWFTSPGFAGAVALVASVVVYAVSWRDARVERRRINALHECDRAILRAVLTVTRDRAETRPVATRTAPPTASKQ